MAAFSYKLENIVDWRLTIFGLMTLFVVYYLQDGIVGFLQNLMGRGAQHAQGVAASGVAPFDRAQGGTAGDAAASRPDPDAVRRPESAESGEPERDPGLGAWPDRA
jgi:branched-chain amino acid transport system permease protein